jgi:uncharacterized protein (TIGR01777 family)
MNIVVSGGTGFIGRRLCGTLVASGHRVTLLTRKTESPPPSYWQTMTIVKWNGQDEKALEQHLKGADAVINLAGAPIADARWTEDRKRLLIESRVMTTRRLVEASSRLTVKPLVFINASGIGYYGAHGDRVLDEASGPGEGFLADLCLQWESAAREAVSHGLRVVCLRIGMVLERDGGALPRMALPFRFFAGGPVMPGNQWISWIHRDDVVGLIEWALSDSKVEGSVNAVAPSPVTMMEFSKTLGRVLHKPSWLPLPAFALKLALGDLSALMTTGQKVAPVLAQRGGYHFRYPFLEGALRAIFGKT